MSDLILYAAIAGVLCLMLYFVLGKDVGESPDTQSPLMPREPSGGVGEPKMVQLDPQFNGPAGAGLSQIAQMDGDFSPAQFINGAAAAYSMILEAYAEGDKATLEGLLDDPVFKSYSAAIDAREAAGQTQSTDLARLISHKISFAERAGSAARIGVEFDAEMTAAIYDAQGELVEGDPDLLSRVTEVWTFERNLKSSDLNWLLSSVQEVGEDTPGSAPDFTPEDKPDDK